MSRQDGAALHHVDRSFREYVEKMDDGHMECKFCGHLFHKDTAITRIRLHIAGVKGRVRICGQVPQDVQEAALAAIQFGVPREKKLETGAGSSNNEGMEQGGEEGRVCSHLDMENTGEGSAQHVHRIVPPTIDVMTQGHVDNKLDKGFKVYQRRGRAGDSRAGDVEKNMED